MAEQNSSPHNNSPNGSAPNNAPEANRDALPSAIAQSRAILTGSLDNGFRFLTLVAVLAGLAILFSGVKVINPQEVAIIKRFGKVVGQNRSEQVHGPGLLLAFPYLIDEVVRVPVKQVQELQITTFSAVPIALDPTPAPTAADALASTIAKPAALDTNMLDGVTAATPMAPTTPGATPTATAAPTPTPTPATDTLDPTLSGYVVTGNKNVVHLTVLVKYTVSDPIKFALLTSEPIVFINDAVSEALTQVVGVTGVDAALTGGKTRLTTAALERAQKRLDAMNVGVQLGAIEIKELRPPDALKTDFDAVTTAYVGMQTALQQARTYRASTVPAAQSARDTAISGAKAAAATRLAQANGDTSLFRNVIAQYRANPGVVKERLYREATDSVMSKVGVKVLVPQSQNAPRIFLPAKIAPSPTVAPTPTPTIAPTPLPGTDPTPTPTPTPTAAGP